MADVCTECNGRGHFLFAFSTPACDACGGTGEVGRPHSSFEQTAALERERARARRAYFVGVLKNGLL